MSRWSQHVIPSHAGSEGTQLRWQVDEAIIPPLSDRRLAKSRRRIMTSTSRNHRPVWRYCSAPSVSMTQCLREVLKARLPPDLDSRVKQPCVPCVRRSNSADVQRVQLVADQASAVTTGASGRIQPPSRPDSLSVLTRAVASRGPFQRLVQQMMRRSVVGNGRGQRHPTGLTRST